MAEVAEVVDRIERLEQVAEALVAARERIAEADALRRELRRRRDRLAVAYLEERRRSALPDRLPEADAAAQIASRRDD